MNTGMAGERDMTSSRARRNDIKQPRCASGWRAIVDRAISADGIFVEPVATRCAIEEARNRPIVVDSRRNRANRELSKFPFEIKSEKF
jgi:hypothetical protein